MGRVAAPHGVRGAVKVQPLSGDPAALLAFDEWLLGRGDAGPWLSRRVRTSALRSGVVAAEFEGIDSREHAATLRGMLVGIPRERLPAPAEDEYYQADLVGMSVVNRDGRTLGSVTGFVDGLAHPILRVAGADGGERLIPWVARYVDGVDVGAGSISVDWAEDY